MPQDKIDSKEGQMLLQETRRALELWLSEKKLHRIEHEHEWLDSKRGVFVTLHNHPKQQLRGCIGFIKGEEPLRECLPKAAIAAATQDPRFIPLEKGELEKVTAEISILTEPRLVKATNPQLLLEKITPGEDGLILKIGPYQGLFLPQVWEQLPSKEEFLAQLCFKAGLADPLAWRSPEAQIFRFRVQSFKESEPKGK